MASVPRVGLQRNVRQRRHNANLPLLAQADANRRDRACRGRRLPGARWAVPSRQLPVLPLLPRSGVALRRLDCGELWISMCIGCSEFRPSPSSAPSSARSRVAAASRCDALTVRAAGVESAPRCVTSRSESRNKRATRTRVRTGSSVIGRRFVAT